MKRQLAVLLLACGSAAFGLADDEADQQAIMKGIGAAQGSMRKNVAAASMDGVAKDATLIADLLKKEEAWWNGKNAADATKFAQDGQAAAKAVAAAASAGKAEDVAAAAKNLGAACQGCHGAHREKLEAGGYKTKM
jgi:cytochrome c556